jgi:hypothetical protein
MIGSDQEPRKKTKRIKLPVFRSGPGPRAKPGGKKITNGKALHVTCYPREGTKAALVAAAERAGQGLSAFLLIAGLEKAAKMRTLATGVECAALELVPAEEYAELLKRRGGKGDG